MTTGQLIKQARDRVRKSVPSAARDCGVSERAWYQLEAEENSPTVSTLKKIANGLPCRIVELVADDDDFPENKSKNNYSARI